MKHRNLIITFIILLVVNVLNAQVIITKNDSIPIGNDSIVKIVLPEVRGSIQWQQSLDSKGWVNLDDETKDTLLIKANAESLYRAIITDGTCIPVISDSVGVVSPDSITRNYLVPTNLGLELVSDSTELANGNYIYTGENYTNEFEIGKVIIDNHSGGTIRKITDIIQSDDTISVKTEQATLEDLFFNTSFKLSTEMIYPSQNLKGASLTEIGKALTDEYGFIHPAEIYTETEDGSVTKSASIHEEYRNTQEGSLFIYKDFTGTELFDLHGPITYKNESGESVSVTGDVKSFIQQGHFKFDPVFKFEFAYKRPEVDWIDLRINKGELDKFAFYADNTQIEFKNIIVTEWNVACILGKEWVLYPNILPPKTFMFYPGGIPLMITFSVDLNCKISTKLGTGSTATIGYYNTNTVTFGARYEKMDWQAIKQLSQGTEVIMPESLYGNLELKVEIYPNVKLKIYDVAGPFVKIGPSITYNYTTSVNQKNWDKSLDLEIDLKLGVAAEIFGKKVLSYTPGNWTLYSNNLFNSPNSLSILSGDNQTGQSGNELSNPIVTKVTNSLDQPVKNVQVYFTPLSGSVSESKVTTDSDGNAQTRWILSSNAGLQSLGVQILDGKDQTIKGGSLTVNATATSSSLPTLTTSAIANITQTTATSGGNITSDGGATITARGVCWSTSQNPTTANSKTTNGTGTGSFVSNLTSLTANTTYYVRAYATNSKGTAYGNEVTFTTGQEIGLPVLSTTAITEITQTNATSGGNITSDGGATITARGVCWSTTPNPTTTTSKTINGTGTGSFVSNLTGLTANTKYYVRAYATNSNGIAYGNEVTFTTIRNNNNDITSDFTDPNFLAAVREVLGKGINDPIFATDSFTSITYLNVNNKYIKSIAGIQHFTSLTRLDCLGNQLTSLPALPSGLTVLWCEQNQLTSLPVLPLGLTWFGCNGNRLTSLPTLPYGLTALYCDGNQLTSLPALPSGLTVLWCSGTRLTSLPTLPSGLTELRCNRSKLTSLPSLPSGLTKLDCEENQLTSLPALPPSLTELDCFGNQLTSLPALPPSLTELDCSGNQLTMLPDLPPSLIFLYCGETQLTSLPTLPPRLTKLICVGTQLTSLPALPSGLTELCCDRNQLTKLPDLPPSLISLYCNGNQLTSLPTLPPDLSVLYSNENQLTSLPTLPPKLTELYCDGNQLTSLSALPSGLKELGCQSNLLTSLPTLPSDLTLLWCMENQLTSLSALPSGLKELDCQDNQLTSLDVSELRELVFLNCFNNRLTELTLNSEAPYSFIDVRWNFMKDESAITIRDIIWDGANFKFLPQK